MNKNSNIIVIILAVSIILCFNFILFHTVPDTYCVLGMENYSDVFLQNGRILSAAYLNIGKALSIPMYILDIISNIMAIIFQSICVYIIYRTITKNEDKVLRKMFYLIGAYLIIYNPLAIEHLAYIECGMICLGKLACVLAAKQLVKEEKIIMPIILVILASICYQGILNVFITVGLIFLIMEEDKQIKPKVKKLIKMGVLCVISMLAMVIVLKIGNQIVGSTQTRLGGNRRNVIELIKIIIQVSVTVLGHGYNLFWRYFIPSVMIVTTLLLLLYKRHSQALIYLGLVIVIVLSCTVPLIFQQSIGTSARITSSIGSILRNINYYVRKRVK